MKKKWSIKRILKWFVILFLLTLPFWLLLLAPTLYFYNAAFGEGAYCATRKKEGFIAKTTCGLSHTYDEYAPYFRFLPSDEKMIENFYEHRADFEKLVKIYRKDFSVPTRFYILDRTPEVLALLKRTDTGGVDGDWILWIPPDPYSKEAEEATYKILEGKKKLKVFTSLDDRAYGGVIIYYGLKVMRLSNFFQKMYRPGIYPVYKDYYYIPVVPKIKITIKSAYLTKPSGDLMKILPTLNEYPPDFGLGDCVVRQIEPQWFIKMCQ